MGQLRDLELITPETLYHLVIPVFPCHTLRIHINRGSSQRNNQSSPYLANTMGSVFKASLSIIGVYGLFLFMVG